jgi:hypothetical protein
MIYLKVKFQEGILLSAEIPLGEIYSLESLISELAEGM